MKQPVSERGVALLPAGILTTLQRLLGWTGTHEQEQAAIRIAILSFALIFLLSNEPTSSNYHSLWVASIKFISILLALSFAIYGSAVIWPGPSHVIRVIGILIDSIGQSYTLYLTGPIGAPWYGLYLWFVLGNGFRYGEKYLYLATAIALTGFTFVALFTPYWIANSELAFGLACTLLLIPAYSAILIRRLNEARRRADAASRAKSDFLSCMSHEIRTPLNGILGMTDLLRLRPLSGEEKDCVETIHVSAHALARQINEILDLSKIESGRMAIETIDFDLYVLVNTTLRIFQTQAQDNGLTLRSVIDPGTPYHLSGDPHKVRQVIINLVGNALKFTHKGSITLKIQYAPVGENSALLRFEVTDTGTGIPQDKLHIIFDPFAQANESISRNYGGTGLGTTICKNFVELMGGTIGVESTLDVGTTFWFEIPFRIIENRPDASVKHWASRCNAIYVSPSTVGNDPVRNKLDQWGINYDLFTTLEEAYTEAKSSGTYDALIINGMPATPLLFNIVNGTDNDLSTDLHVVLLGCGMQIQAFQHIRQAVFVLDTPLENNHLLNVLHACYSKHGTEDDIIHFAHKQSLGKRLGQGLNILVADDNSINRLVMQRMLDKLGHRSTIVNGGEVALRALENDDFDAVIVDKNMPDMGGIEVYQTYCLAHGGDTPVQFAILTADATEEAKSNCAVAGIKHFLTKPISLVRLTEMLSDICSSNSGNESRTELEIDFSQENSHSIEIFDEAEFEKLLELSSGDLTFIRDVINNFIDDTYENLQRLEAAVARGDWIGFRDLAHALKGSARYLGLTQIADLAKDMQNMPEQEFKHKGIGNIIGLGKAADAAFEILQDRLSRFPTEKAAG
jgi:two-component system sensor histidine kinase RpfC